MTDALMDPLVNEIEAALKVATPGPWFAGWSGNPELESKDEAGPITVVSGGRGGVCEAAPIASGDANTWDRVEANTHLIAHAPEWLQALVGRLRAVEQERDRLEHVWRDADARADGAEERNRQQELRIAAMGGSTEASRDLWREWNSLHDALRASETQVATLRAGLVAILQDKKHHPSEWWCGEIEHLLGVAGVGSPTGAPHP